MSNLPSDFYTLRGVRRLCYEAGVQPSKGLGQNFLYHRRTLEAMVRDIDILPGSCVIEVGCGFGHLTGVLVSERYRVVAFEMDERLAEIARTYLSGDAEVIHADILSVDLSSWTREGEVGGIVGNLPYSSGTSILFHLLDWHFSIPVWGFLLQREVADRIRAAPGSSRYGRLSVVLQYLFTVQNLRRVGPSVFFPRPRVESVWIRLLPRRDTDFRLARDWMEPLAKAAFSHRRKKLVTNLDGISIGGRLLTKDLILNQLSMLGLSTDCRPQDVSADQFAAFAEALRRSNG